MNMRFFVVKNFEQFQHYKDRSPPWIKFYNAVLDDYAFTSLPDASRSHLVAIWLLASRTNNRIPYDAAWVGQAIKASSPVDLDALADAGFIVAESDATETVATCKRDASKPLDQRREEGEGEKSREDGAQDAPPVVEFDPLRAVFSDGLKYLQSAGVPERHARGLLGKWRKTAGDGAVIEALAEASRKSVSEPIAWVEKAIRARASPPRRAIMPMGPAGG